MFERFVSVMTTPQNPFGAPQFQAPQEQPDQPQGVPNEQPNPFQQGQAPQAGMAASPQSPQFQQPTAPQANAATPQMASQGVAQEQPQQTPNFQGFAQGADYTQGDRAKIIEDKDCCVVVRPLEFIHDLKTRNGLVDAIKADWVVIDGPNAGAVRHASLVFNKVLVNSFRECIGTSTPFVVGVVDYGAGANGNNPPVILRDPTPAQMQMAASVPQQQGWLTDGKTPTKPVPKPEPKTPQPQMPQQGFGGQPPQPNPQWQTAPQQGFAQPQMQQQMPPQGYNQQVQYQQPPF